MRRLLLVIALFGAWLPLAHADDRPAQMVSGKRSIEELLRIPKSLPPGRYSLHCGLLIGTSGWVLFARCYSPNGWAPYELQKAVMYAAKTSLFVPATRKGKRVEVFTTVTVLIDTTLGDALILAVPNDGADAARYGRLYSAPQRYGGSHISRPDLRLHDPVRTAVVWMELQIDEHGVMTNCKVMNHTDAPDWWVNEVNRAAKQMTFIPGNNNGKPEPMLFVQPMLWRY